MQRRFLATVFLVLLCAGPVRAEHAFWVLGSFVEQEGARSEGARLAGDTDFEILLFEAQVKERFQYRLLTAVPEDEAARRRQLQRLGQAGISEPWTLRLPGDLPFMETIFAEISFDDIAFIDDDIDVERADEPVFDLAENYVVAGSFKEMDRAQALVDRLSIGYPVTIQPSEISGQTYHRVLVGPVSALEENSVTTLLSTQGVDGAWVLRSEFVAAPSVEEIRVVQESQDMTPVVRDLSVSTTPASRVSEPVPQYDGDYNPAMLKKKSTPFPIPGKAKRASSSNPGRWRTDIASEFRVFNDPGLNDLEEFHPSVSVQTEYYKTWNGGNDIVAFVPFYRWDQQDDERTHFDIRELTWVHVTDDWELRTGIRKVFWGVTESQHLVDIINQTDYVENQDGEEKLGQPMINLSLTRDWGVIDFFVLPGFRERTFPGEDGRPRWPFPVDVDNPIYESSAERYRTDAAVRWTNYFGDLEVGLSHFSGTSREPRFEVDLRVDEFGTPNDVVLTPVYDVIDQTGLDAQYFIGDWAWKLEAISRSGQGDRFSAVTFGFEKTFVGIFGSRGDLGVVAEYLFDDRGEQAPVIGEDDVALGFRYTVNNPADTTALLVWLYDVDSDEYLMTLEASSRLGEKWKMILEASFFNGGDTPTGDFSSVLNAFADPESELGLFQEEDFIKLEFIRYF
ncbi:MAG: SPOR domain-containing protein [Pseudomonadales bacterium]|nr:SPOR domain-containing protein [Pseudomonadales bacterium]MBO6595932.1 SPOR domain-containing protein [Pseudomonadales bacterium]MBO6822415.1 SPOR domain-containing protein [Pseudomonadales bacterium]